MSSQTIKAIETEYAGCRFRSRLEARWAVFFDHLGIRWEYEPEGLDIEGVRYLPDFQMTTHIPGLYVEVKGRMDTRGMRKVLALARSGHLVLVLGNVPRPDDLGPHFILFRREHGVVNAYWVSFFPVVTTDEFTLVPHGWPVTVADDDESTEQCVGIVNDPSPGGLVLISTPVAAAFEAARSARFARGF